MLNSIGNYFVFYCPNLTITTLARIDQQYVHSLVLGLCNLPLHELHQQQTNTVCLYHAVLGSIAHHNLF